MKIPFKIRRPFKEGENVVISTKYAVKLKVPYFSDENCNGEIVFCTPNTKGTIYDVLNFGSEKFIVVEDRLGCYWGTVHRGKLEVRRERIINKKKGDIK